MPEQEPLSSKERELINKWSRSLTTEHSLDFRELVSFEKVKIKSKFKEYYMTKVSEALQQPDMKNGNIPTTLQNWKKIVTAFPEEDLNVLIENLKKERT